MNEFFSDLGSRLAAAAGARGSAVEPPALDPEVAFELLELARVTAHTRERRFAPLACYLAGVGAERMRVARGTMTAAEVAAYINDVRQSLESLSAPE
jgi:uncharacterized protein (DUF849 family)